MKIHQISEVCSCFKSKFKSIGYGLFVNLQPYACNPYLTLKSGVQMRTEFDYSGRIGPDYANYSSQLDD